MNKKEKEQLIKICTDIKVQENKFIVVDELKFDEIKTKNLQKGS